MYIQKWNKLTLIHDMFDTPVVSRIANRVVIDKYQAINQEFILILSNDNSTSVLPLRKGVPTVMLPNDARFLFLVRNKKDVLNFSQIQYDYAKKLLSEQPVLNKENLAKLALSVESTLTDCFFSNTLPNIQKSNPDNWTDFLRVFKKQGNDVMSFFIANAICSFDIQLSKQS